MSDNKPAKTGRLTPESDANGPDVARVTLPRAHAKVLRELLEGYENPDWWTEAEYAALAALDAALAEPDAIARAVEAEREAICELADNLLRTSDAVTLIDAIRARGSGAV